MKRGVVLGLGALTLAGGIAVLQWFTSSSEVGIGPATRGIEATEPTGDKYRRSPRRMLVNPDGKRSSSATAATRKESTPRKASEEQVLSPGPALLTEPEENSSSMWPLTKEGIDSAMFERLEDIRSCYQQALSGDQESEGTVTVSFTIKNDERTAGSYVRGVNTDSNSDELLDQVMMRGCLATVIEELRFEPSTTGEPTQVRYPFVFSPDED